MSGQSPDGQTPAQCQRSSWVPHRDEMLVTLAGGRVVAVKALHMSRTYESLILGTPDEKYNEQIVARHVRGAGEVWDGWAVHLIAPVAQMCGDVWRTWSELPALTYRALLKSAPLSESEDWSEAVVLWFGPARYDLPISQIVQAAITEIPWESFAQDGSL